MKVPLGFNPEHSFQEALQFEESTGLLRMQRYLLGVKPRLEDMIEQVDLRKNATFMGTSNCLYVTVRKCRTTF